MQHRNGVVDGRQPVARRLWQQCGAGHCGDLCGRCRYGAGSDRKTDPAEQLCGDGFSPGTGLCHSLCLRHGDGYLFEVGDQVNAGDVLFKIDDSAAKLQLEQAQLSAANVRQQADSALTTQQESANIQMDSSRVQAQSGYDQAQIAYVQAKNAYDQNYDDLSDQIDACNANITQLENAIKAASSSVSGGNASSVVQMKTQIETLKGTKKQLESSRNSLVAGLQQAESAYNAAKSSMNIVDRSQALSQGQALEDTKKQLSTSEQLANVGVESAELALSYYTVKAPISGTIQSKGVEVNGIAGSSNPAYTIANENMMTVTFQVSEAVKIH